VANGVVRAIKDGRKVTAYQIVNVNEVKEYMRRAGVTIAQFVPGQIQKKPSISKLADLEAEKDVDTDTTVQSEEVIATTEKNQETV
jgi:hypothetical protein